MNSNTLLPLKKKKSQDLKLAPCPCPENMVRDLLFRVCGITGGMNLAMHKAQRRGILRSSRTNPANV